MRNIEDPRFACNICLEQVSEPVVTRCGHLFCWPCLYQWLEPGMTQAERESLSSSTIFRRISHSVDPTRRMCPVCKTESSVSTVIPIYVREVEEDSNPKDASLEEDGPGIDSKNLDDLDNSDDLQDGGEGEVSQTNTTEILSASTTATTGLRRRRRQTQNSDHSTGETSASINVVRRNSDPDTLNEIDISNHELPRRPERQTLNSDHSRDETSTNINFERNTSDPDTSNEIDTANHELPRRPQPPPPPISSSTNLGINSTRHVHVRRNTTVDTLFESLFNIQQHDANNPIPSIHDPNRNQELPMEYNRTSIVGHVLLVVGSIVLLILLLS